MRKSPATQRAGERAGQDKRTEVQRPRNRINSGLFKEHKGQGLEDGARDGVRYSKQESFEDETEFGSSSIVTDLVDHNKKLRLYFNTVEIHRKVLNRKIP